MGLPFSIYEASIDDVLRALDEGTVTAVELVAAHLARVGRFDRSSVRLNAMAVLNPNAFAEAAESDRRRRAGQAGSLEGVPFTVKDSYMVAGLTVAAGSPAFKDLVAQDDAFTVARIREAGGVLVGKTNMPPMADGGMQRGVYGRAESPYNTNYLAAAYASGSSNGSAVATAASMGVFGMGEETVSSGRSPASNNGLCAYTPSRGVISIRGNWPLFPTRDVVVPHTRSMNDMFRLLDVIVADDENTTGDFWRDQKAVALPAASDVRPGSYAELADPEALKGKRLGVPRMYLGKDADFPLAVRDSILELWDAARTRLESLGATVVEVDLPMIEKYEGNTPGGEQLAALGILPEGWMDIEFNEILAHGWDTFLRANNDPALNRLADVDHTQIFPAPAGSLPDRYEEVEDYENRYRDVVNMAAAGLPPVALPAGLRPRASVARSAAQGTLRGLAGGARAGRNRLPGQRGRRGPGLGHQHGIRGPCLGKRGVLLQRKLRAAPLRHSEHHRGHGNHGRHRHAGGADHCRCRLRRQPAAGLRLRIRSGGFAAPGPGPGAAAARRQRLRLGARIHPGGPGTAGNHRWSGVRSRDPARGRKAVAHLGNRRGTGKRLDPPHRQRRRCPCRPGRKHLECHARAGRRRRARGRRLESRGQRRPGGCQRGGADGCGGRGLRRNLVLGVE